MQEAGSESFSELGDHNQLVIADITHQQLKMLLDYTGWSYAVNWLLISSDHNSLPALVWSDGLEMMNTIECPPMSDYQRIKDFFYKSCVFAVGYGFAGNAFQSGRYLWLNRRQDANINVNTCLTIIHVRN
ncbi:hypothetical protein O6H91_02G104100 [Diphasiastrum complanatum]|uniref:Uncharacterized protein n=1 Tax=Diphasiastrum complanatum TaxID=34168 RepID=A0ACC2EIP1_DIPCM|nr:hypothetical protein O6H91_02G104100 [Diphasiastrum complanatum]